MAFFKRPEVWVLLLLSVAGVAWVLWSDAEHDRAEVEGSESAEEVADGATEEEDGSSRFAIRACRVSREEGHLIVTVRVATISEQALAEPLALEAPAVKLITEDGTSVAPFFLPFDPPPRLDAEAGAFADLRYWLPFGQASDALWLEIDGDRLPVKTAGELASDQFPEGTEVAVNGLDWKA